MEFAGTLTGGNTHVRKYQVNSTFARAGVIARAPGANNAGVVIATTTSAADAVGLCLDSATYVTAQQSALDAERKISLIMNPDQIIKALFSGDASDGTALELQTVTTATTDGLDVTTAAEWSNPTYDEGAVWGYQGANAGQIRKITSVSSTAGTVTVAFENDHAVGDTFIRVPVWPLGTASVTLTTNLTQVRADSAVATNTAALRCLDILHKDIGGEGRTKSAALYLLNDPIFRDAT